MAADLCYMQINLGHVKAGNKDTADYNLWSTVVEMFTCFYRSSGILDDSESDTLLEGKSRGDSVSSPPPTPTSQGPEIRIESLPGTRDDYLSQAGKSSRYET